MKRSINLFPLLLISLVVLLLNWYVLQGLSALFPPVWVKILFYTFTLGLFIMLYVAIYRMRNHGMDRLFKTTVHIFLVLIVAELIFASISLVGDAFRVLLGITGNNGKDGAFLPAKIWVVSAISLGASLIVILFFIDGILRGKYAYKVIHQKLYFNDLPSAFDGFKVLQISDVHAGSFDNAKAVQRGIDLIKAQKADLFVFTGDLVNNKAQEIKPWISCFNQIKAPYGQFSVLGNHDYGDYIAWENPSDKINNLEALKSYHKEIGFKLLLDEHVDIEKEGETIILAGVENWGIGFGERGDLQKALEHTEADQFKLLLSHDPSHFESQVKNYPSKINLTLSGHTHGMQFGIEFLGLKWSPAKYRYKHWAGLKKENNRFLYINRGFGFLGFSGRVGIWPEITVIELKKG